MVKVIMKDKIITGTTDYEINEGRVYFPLGTNKKEFLKVSDYHTTYSIKGHANYYDVIVNGKINKDAAWHYLKQKKGL